MAIPEGELVAHSAATASMCTVRRFTIGMSMAVKSTPLSISPEMK